jgi:membrane-associated PAP2 superfamily phosphatase
MPRRRSVGVEEPLTFMPNAWRRDLGIALIALLAVVGWDVSGGDWAVAQHYGSAVGFAARRAVWAETLHDAGRWLAGLAWLALLVSALWPSRSTQARNTTALAAAGVLIAALLVATIKHRSATECPWSLQAFGGGQAYVSHWVWTTTSAPGGCFPSGHASAAFAFLPVAVLWRHQHPRGARFVLWASVLLGLAFGWLQVMRGAHFVSHVLWAAWLCWLVATALPLLLRCAAWRPFLQPQSQPRWP